MLPDVALLEIFDFYVDRVWHDTWRPLVHVCRKWRNIVFGSPLRLSLQLRCRAGTPVRETLDVWPLLPIAVSGHGYKDWGVDNILAVLEHNDRIRELDLYHGPVISSWQLEKVLAAMQQPFPALTHLYLQSETGEIAPVVPASFLDGSALPLVSLWLKSIPFPGLPKLLLSATHLVQLYLWSIPHSGYFSPESMAICLSMLTRLETLYIEFESPQSRPDRRDRHQPPQIRTLPVLTALDFKGVCEYLEELVARIDAPLLYNLRITFLHQLILDTPQLSQFISRTPNFKTPDEVHLEFSSGNAQVAISSPFVLRLGISSRHSDWQLLFLAQICISCFPQAFIPAVERLYILDSKHLPAPLWQDDIEGSQWLELLHPFTAVKDLYISREFVTRIAPTLQELVGERATEALPALRTLFLKDALSSESGPVQEAIEQFITARQHCSHPITVSRWERKGGAWQLY